MSCGCSKERKVRRSDKALLKAGQAVGQIKKKVKGQRDFDEAEKNAQTCKKCPAYTRVKKGLVTCGLPGQRKMSGPIEERTCGCDLSLKVLVKGEKCPRGKW